MIVKTRHGGDHLLRTGWPDHTIPPRPWAQPSSAGEVVTEERAFGLPAFGAAVRMVAGVIASGTLNVFEGMGASKIPQPDCWQADLFARPTLDGDAFSWMWDIASSLEACENAVLQKIKGAGRVLELRPVPMNYVTIYIDRATGQKTFQIATTDGVKKYGTGDMLHIRGSTIGPGVMGVSKLEQHRDPTGAMLAAQHFEGAYFRNYQRPDIALLFPAGVTQEQANQWRDGWDTEYRGAENFGKAIPLGNGATIQPIPVSLADAQFLQLQQLAIEDASRILDVHALLLGHSPDRLPPGTLQEATNFFLHLQLPPRLIRIAQAFKADPDLFPGGNSYPEITIDDLRFLDPLTLAQVEHQKIQDGTALVDEVRANHGQPPLPPIPADPSQTPGMVPQLTPVGGAPNPQSDPGLADTDPEA